MNYPIWELLTIGGGSLVALIAVLHVYISHLAVGGGMFIWLTDLKGYRENNPDIHAYVKKHTWFFLLLTMVFGGMSGVGIWFIISLVNPAATSSLIHNFVFGWAIEWVFFLGEITALLVYYYFFDKLGRKHRLNIAFLYFLFAWLSLVIINGILAYMLTPGHWLESKYFWDGFFNPTYFSSLFFRTFMTMIIAGLFGYVTSVFIKDETFRMTMMRYCSKWLLYPIAGLIPSAIWYYYTIPESVRVTAFLLNPQTEPFMQLFVFSTAGIFILGIILSLRVGLAMQRTVTAVLVLIGLLWMGGFEYSREDARKPYIINQYMYSTSILKSDVAQLNEEGVLKNAKWTAVKEINSDNFLEAGRELFNLQCLSCHTIDGIRNDIVKQTEDFTYLGMISQLKGQGKILDYMPDFVGTDQEMEALAAFITSGLQKKDLKKFPDKYEIAPLKTEIPKFDRKTDDYILLVWNDLGMHCVSDSDPWFVILPPANTLEAQLIKRDEVPEIISEDVEITYQVEEGHRNPAGHVDFWKHVESNFGTVLEDNIGLHGNGLSGKFTYDDERSGFIAQTIPVVPYRDDGIFSPYPVFSVEARDSESGELLVSTKVVAPTSTEMGCKNCHGGGWRIEGVAGLSDETAINILKAHDRLNGTDLYQEAVDGKPRLCQSCHADPALGTTGDSTLLNFSTSMHGWHANYMPVEGSLACTMCHPAYANGRTRCSRGVHGAVGVTCIDCHGELSDHAIALLKGQSEKPKAARLLANLHTVKADSKEDVLGRLPWLNEPDCLTCHEDFEKPEEGATAFNTWNEEFSELYRIRTGNGGVRCEACHGSTHALYPAENPFGKNRDNMQPMQYSNQPFPIGSNRDCQVCHKQKMEDPVHHENMDRMFRNVVAIGE